MARSLREWTAPRSQSGAVLFLHGGREKSHEPVRPYRLAVVRVRLLAWSLRRRLHAEGISVWTLRFSVRGWNGDEMSPVVDARWALGEIERKSEGRPIVVVGHSMGGRTAVRVADAPGVVGVIGLAPWLPPGEPVTALRGRRLVIAHGNADRTTDPALSRTFADHARGTAGSVEYEVVPDDGHALLRHPRYWNGLVISATLKMLGTSASEAPSIISGG